MQQTYFDLGNFLNLLEGCNIGCKPARCIKLLSVSDYYNYVPYFEDCNIGCEPARCINYVPSKKSSRKQLPGVQIRETPGVSVSKKKTPTKAERSKRIDLLSEAALLEEAQVKKVLKRSRRETTIHQAGGSGDGASLQPEVPNEPKGKSVDTHEGTGLKPGVPDVSKDNSSESEYESWGDSSDEANEQGDDEDVLESDDDYEQAADETTDS
ncbi:hypothetical protein Tco_0362954 [Tanacetum coccineum]